MNYKHKQPNKDQELAERVKKLSDKYPRFGYRRIGVMLEWEFGENINVKRIYRIWKMLNLQLPKKRPGSDPVKLQAEHTNHVWSYDFVSDRAANGQKLKVLVVAA